MVSERAREQIRRERGDARRRFHRSQSPSFKKTVTPGGVTVGPIGNDHHDLFVENICFSVV